MSSEDDITRIRTDVQDIYDKHRDLLARVVTLEERSNNRDEKIEELKTSISDLKKNIEDKLTGLSIQISTLANASAQKVAGRWEEVVKTVITVGVTALVMWFVGKA